MNNIARRRQTWLYFSFDFNCLFNCLHHPSGADPHHAGAQGACPVKGPERPLHVRHGPHGPPLSTAGNPSIGKINAMLIWISAIQRGSRSVAVWYWMMYVSVDVDNFKNIRKANPPPPPPPIENSHADCWQFSKICLFKFLVHGPECHFKEKKEQRLYEPGSETLLWLETFPQSWQLHVAKSFSSKFFLPPPPPPRLTTVEWGLLNRPYLPMRQSDGTRV